jgi:hypothetical protein
VSLTIEKRIPNIGLSENSCRSVIDFDCSAGISFLVFRTPFIMKLAKTSPTQGGNESDKRPCEKGPKEGIAMADKDVNMKKALEGTPPMRTNFAKRYGLILALVVLAIVLALPTPEGLSIAGQRMLGVLCFAVVVWITETVTYPVSATLIASLMLILLGTAPSLVPAQAAAGKVIGSVKPSV